MSAISYLHGRHNLSHFGGEVRVGAGRRQGLVRLEAQGAEDGCLGSEGFPAHAPEIPPGPEQLFHPLVARSRVLEKELIPVGATASRSVDVRILAATHTDLRKETREGRFRKDLYYRLDVFRLELPPLRDRRTDILLLVEHFLTHWRRAGEDEGPALEDAEGVRSRAARLLEMGRAARLLGMGRAVRLLGMGRTVRLLGMGRATLWRKMKEYGIEVE